MKIQPLNGTWQYRIGGGRLRRQEVPFSALPVGHSECVRSFDLCCEGRRVFLRFDGIAYHATVTLNGQTVGEMLPYCEYTFDVTDTVKEQGNHLLVSLEDISPAFGPSAGWGNYGGITRGVSLLYAEESYIDDVFFHAVLQNGYRDADYTVELTAGGEMRGLFRVTLSLDGKTVDSYTVPVREPPVMRRVRGVQLWSPESPVLYELTVELLDGERVLDTNTCAVGFRELACNRHRFLLNGKELFLQGVCRHETVADYGHTVPYAVVEADMRRIKGSGCNYVRLVHYPHSKDVLEIADRLGLMVSEEPGLWWSDTADPAVSAGSLEVLRRTILRDRNHPSIVFWLCFNECRLTEQFLLDAVRVSRENDPYRLVSGANCMSPEETLQYYNRCSFDFYTMHPYAPDLGRTVEAARVLHDKPLLLTEWGGYFVYDNPHLLSDFIHGMYKLYLANGDEGALAGACFWYWAEVYDCGRARPACYNGVLKEALVDRQGNPTLIYEPFCRAWREAKRSERAEELYAYQAYDRLDKKPMRGAGGALYGDMLVRASRGVIPAITNMRGHLVTVGPRLQKEEQPGVALIPFVLAEGSPVTFTGDGVSDTVTLLGAVCVPGGYPVSGTYGEVLATVTVTDEKGVTEHFVLRNGIEITTAFTTLGSSRIDPQAERATRFASFSYDKNFENYIMNRLDLRLSATRRIRTVELCSTGPGDDLLLYGVFL
jgi:hypothetical protein